MYGELHSRAEQMIVAQAIICPVRESTPQSSDYRSELLTTRPTGLGIIFNIKMYNGIHVILKMNKVMVIHGLDLPTSLSLMYSILYVIGTFEPGVEQT